MRSFSRTAECCLFFSNASLFLGSWTDSVISQYLTKVMYSHITESLLCCAIYCVTPWVPCRISQIGWLPFPLFLNIIFVLEMFWELLLYPWWWEMCFYRLDTAYVWLWVFFALLFLLGICLTFHTPQKMYVWHFPEWNNQGSVTCNGKIKLNKAKPGLLDILNKSFLCTIFMCYSQKIVEKQKFLLDFSCISKLPISSMFLCLCWTGC